jgi:ubiquinone/menaquinone biosynthesis C-methylase UbiE
MEPLRKPFQGVVNIIRFNRHLYLIAIAVLAFALTLSTFAGDAVSFFIKLVCLLVFLSISVSLLVSFYIYDLSGLYKLNWLSGIAPVLSGKMININAGFDEISILLRNKYPAAQLTVLDFYNESRHTEVSIRRARKAYSAYPGTIQISTENIPLANGYVDDIFLIMAAHEIRNESERVVFFKELKRILHDDGKIIVTEHLRDFSNFIAYNIGFFHFHSYSSWKKTFASSELIISEEIKITPFLTTFVLKKNGNTP